MKRSSAKLSILYRFVAAAVLLFLLAPPVAAADKDVRYVGSTESDKYHYLDCRGAKKIHLENVVYFDSAQLARKAGYVPCKVCKPPSH